MNQITFNYHSNIFIKAGIIGFHIYAERVRKEDTRFEEVELELSSRALTVRGQDVLGLLRAAYFRMEEDWYYTPTQKEFEEKGKLYFTREPFEAVAFSKAKTAGLALLITNDIRSVPEGEKTKFETLIEADPSFAMQIAQLLTSRGEPLKSYNLVNGQLVKLGKQDTNAGGYSEIYIGNRYRKVPEIPFLPAYFEATDKGILCPVLGEKFAKLEKSSAGAVFWSGITSFNSLLSGDLNISAKAKYLVLFSPVLGLYSSNGGNLICHFVNMPSLTGMRHKYNQYRELFFEKEEMRKIGYSSNFKNAFYRTSEKKEGEKKYFNDFTLPAESTFSLMYSLYRSFLRHTKEFPASTGASRLNTMRQRLGLEQESLSLTTFSAAAFASTMRPNSYEEYNQFLFVMGFFEELESTGIDLGKVVSTLRLSTRQTRILKELAKRLNTERQLRNALLDRVMRKQRFVDLMEAFQYDCFNELIAGEPLGFKAFSELLNFFTCYEQYLDQSEDHMNEEQRTNAISLGRSIGFSILNKQDGSDPREHAKDGRKYIIGLHKARTLEQFNEAIIRIQNKYSVVVKNELLASVNEENFTLVKQFTIISALSMINSVLNKSTESKNEA